MAARGGGIPANESATKTRRAASRSPCAARSPRRKTCRRRVASRVGASARARRGPHACAAAEDARLHEVALDALGEEGLDEELEVEEVRDAQRGLVAAARALGLLARGPGREARDARGAPAQAPGLLAAGPDGRLGGPGAARVRGAAEARAAENRVPPTS